jgi:MarR family transcriptional regulator, organic hydroperoxide resistance regulator
MAKRPETAAPALDDFLCFAVYSLGHAFNKLYQPLLKRLNLTYPQYVTMVALWEQDDVTVTQLGDRLHLDSGTLTPLLKRLEAAGLVARERDKEDERQVRIRLTKAGAALKDKARAISDTVLCATGRTVGDLRRLKDDLMELRDHLNAPSPAA